MEREIITLCHLSGGSEAIVDAEFINKYQRTCSFSEVQPGQLSFGLSLRRDFLPTQLKTISVISRGKVLRIQSQSPYFYKNTEVALEFTVFLKSGIDFEKVRPHLVAFNPRNNHT